MKLVITQEEAIKVFKTKYRKYETYEIEVEPYRRPVSGSLGIGGITGDCCTAISSHGIPLAVKNKTKTKK